MKNTILAVVALLVCGIARATDLVQVHGSQINPLCTITAASFIGPLTGAVTGRASTCGNADTVTNGLYSSGSYSRPSWLVAIGSTIVSGLSTAAVGNATTVTNGVYTNTSNVFTSDNNFSLEFDTATAGGNGALTTLTCPSGKYALSGGCSCTSVTASTTTINRPDGVTAGTMPTGWACQEASVAGGACSVYVLCGKIHF